MPLYTYDTHVQHTHLYNQSALSCYLSAAVLVTLIVEVIVCAVLIYLYWVGFYDSFQF